MSTTDAAHDFWTGDAPASKYEDLAREFEQNIEQYHPGVVTSKGMCLCLDYCSYCGWAASKVQYYRHNGPVLSKQQ